MRIVFAVMICIVLIICCFVISLHSNVIEDPVSPVFSMRGRNSKIEKHCFYRVESGKAWNDLWLLHQTGKLEAGNRPETFSYCSFDFKKYMIIAIFQGKDHNCNGYEIYSIQEDNDKMTVKVEEQHFQTLNSLVHTQAWGFFVLPRTGKSVVIEFDKRKLINDPPLWTKVVELKPGDWSTEK